MIEFSNVSKSYNKGAIKAVDQLNLSIKPGEIFGFLGPNGAGKTTTIKMLVGLLKSDSGTIKVKGHDIEQEPLKVKSAISYVPDNAEVYEKLSGLEYLNFFADVYSVPARARKERMERFLELFEMSKSVGNLIQSYSHGMRQKIVLIGALLHQPDVFILDEPMVGLDPKSAHNLKEYMREHCDQGKTVFFSTHVLEVAEKLCDRIGIIRRGQLISCGTMSQLKEQAQNEGSLEKIFLELTEA
ncbi:MAG: ABC transporter ATP-binding protein [Firmicutes bacterium]|nr:ABC transporter ATP-binding protein [Bacillota bacterium]